MEPASRPDPKVKIGLVGDLHGAFDAEDARYFNRSDYDLLLFTGDLGSGTAHNGIQVAREVARLEKPTLVVAGNNDAPFAAEIAAEFKFRARMAALMRVSSESSDEQDGVGLLGYDLRTYTFRGYSFSVLVGRPYARGGSELFHLAGLEQRYGVASLASSEARLVELVAAAPTRDVLWLAHNGPYGLGGNGTDIWGADFLRDGGDWGDTDLQTATVLSKKSKRVLAVVAGHMHRTGRARVDPKEGARAERGPAQPRTSVRESEGCLYVNPAVVPRIFASKDGTVRHHMALNLYEHEAPSVRDVWVLDSGLEATDEAASGAGH
jgi:uncharacterized protein (TIGR04168 family)